MNGYWTETRPNGKPLEPGTFCWVTEMEGINPIFTYGKTMEEVVEKLARNNAHAQAALARRNAPIPASPTPSVPPTPRPAMSADEIMRNTLELQNPATAGAAAARLIQESTGVDFGQIALQNFAAMAMAWETENPDFWPHPGNKRLLIEQAKRYAGGLLPRVTKEILTQAFTELRQGGYLLEEPANNEPPPSAPTPPNLTTFPGESPVQRTERPRGSRFATGARSLSLLSPQTVPAKTLKYTANEIRTMPEYKSRELIDSNDVDYAEACEFYFGDTRTSA